MVEGAAGGRKSERGREEESFTSTHILSRILLLLSEEKGKHAWIFKMRKIYKSYVVDGVEMGRGWGGG